MCVEPHFTGKARRELEACKAREVRRRRRRTPGSEEAVRRCPRRLGDRLLREEARRGDHAQPRVRQLLLLYERG